MIDEAVDAILHGDAIVVPTDTVYGLVASPHTPEPVRHLYELKGRTPVQPIALMSLDVDALMELVPELRGRSEAIARALLPGAYTLVLPNPAHRFRWLAGNNAEAIGVRVPDLPETTAAILTRVGAFAATSANLAGGPDPARTEDLAPELRERVAVVVEGGELPGTASTVIDFSGAEPTVLREGAGDGALALERARAATA
ncbi:MAG: L-threonylcarbamoyladenylate synthase [Gaiellaceae bacterium]